MLSCVHIQLLTAGKHDMQVYIRLVCICVCVCTQLCRGGMRRNGESKLRTYMYMYTYSTHVHVHVHVYD